MPRANRYFVENQICHLTHRCHDRQFLLRFARDRERYRQWLREATRRYHLSVFGFCITSNHTHIIATAADPEAIGRAMDLIEGTVAGQYNRRKRREGAFWTGRYHATLIDTGDYLWNCLKYVDLNMVRAGVVGHPRHWRWCGYGELIGERQRYRLLAVEELLRALGGKELREFQQQYKQEVQAAIELRQLQRQGCWTENLAVGSEEFVRRMQQRMQFRQRLELASAELADGMTVWTLKEAPAAYERFCGVGIAS